MGNISELTWDKLIDAEVAKPTSETRERALRFFAEAGFEHPQQCMGLKTGELIQGRMVWTGQMDMWTKLW